MKDIQVLHAELHLEIDKLSDEALDLWLVRMDPNKPTPEQMRERLHSFVGRINREVCEAHLAKITGWTKAEAQLRDLGLGPREK